ncbi:MAG: phosphotransferase [Rhodospirillales bacterium]|nr:phosphotransferase [Rhodospirillales bacterium]
MTACAPDASSPCEAARRDFLGRAGGWAFLAPVGADSSSRSYLRVQDKTGKTAILMESALDSSPLSTPGHKISDFLRIADALRGSGLHTPEIYAAAPDQGFVLMEDFGDVSFRAALEAGADPVEVYTLAANVLIHLRGAAPDLALPDYFASPVHTGRRRIVDWLLPVQRRAVNPDGLAEDYLSVWDKVQSALPPPMTGFLHVDFHVDNLMWVEGKQGLDRCGLLDFQGAMRGPLAYDLANLLGDMRVDVPDVVHDPVMTRFCAGMTRQDAESTRLWCAVLSAQFHCRMAGQVIRLALVGGKPLYLSYLPRILRLLRADLTAPILEPIRRWMDENNVDLSPPGAINPEEIKKFIRPDAF